MKRVIAVALFALASSAMAQVHVNGYFKKDGTYVQPHERTAPDNTKLNNYSTQGNVNPYTGQPGTKNPYAQPSQYAQPVQPIQQVQPVQALQPIRPVQPIQPIQPLQPLQPMQPLTPPNGF